MTRHLVTLTALSVLGLAACGAPPDPMTAPTPPPSAPTPSPLPVPKGPTPVSVSMESVGLDASALDKSVSPCTDFYQFACGGWIQKTEIPADRPRWNRSFAEIGQKNEKELRAILEDAAAGKTTDPVSKKIGSYYGACMDEASIEKNGLKPLDAMRKTIKGVRDAKTLVKAVAELHKIRIWPLFDIDRNQDFGDATRVIAQLDQNGLGLPDRDYYVKDDDKSKDIRTKYLEHVGRMMVLAGYNQKEAKVAADEIMTIETELAKASKTRVERRDPKALYNKTDRAGLAKTAPDFDWNLYFASLGFPDLKDLNVTSPKFFTEVGELAKTIKPASWRYYLDLVLIRGSAQALPKAFVEEQFAMTKVITGQPQQRDRWKRCVEATDQALGELVAQPFVERKFGKESKEAVEKMVFGIRDSFKEEVGTLDWMDGKTKAKALSKLDAMAYLIGYPAKWREYTFDVDAKNYVGDLMSARAAEEKRRLAKVGQPLDREEWQMTPPTVNAYYDPQLNHMVFPAGILQPPFYNPKASVAVNLGAMGMVVGHELTHGFDDEGSQFAGNGNLQDWWESDVKTKFEAKGTCVADQYSAYESIPGVKVNGRLTLGENIADIGGVKLAFHTYQRLRKEAAETQVADGFSEDQQFFLSVGQAWCTKMRDDYARLAVQTDPHSPPRFRVNGSLSDTPEFAQAFQCAAGTPMRPEKACSVW